MYLNIQYFNGNVIVSGPLTTHKVISEGNNQYHVKVVRYINCTSKDLKQW